MLYSIKSFFARLKWISAGRPMIKYSGFNCGCCGKGWKIPFKVEEYESGGEWWDTWGLCPEDKGCREKDILANVIEV